MKRKSFEDLEFIDHHIKPNKWAEMHIKDNYYISVLFGDMFYSNGVDTYEAAVLAYNEDKSSFKFIDPVPYIEKGHQVAGHLSKDKVQKIIDHVYDKL